MTLTINNEFNGSTSTVTGEQTTRQYSFAGSTSDAATGASGSAVSITYAASGSANPTAHVVSGVAWSYNAAPSGGGITIYSPSGSAIFSADITAAGPGFIPFPQPKKTAPNTALIITLSSGSTGVVGKVNALNHWTE